MKTGGPWGPAQLIAARQAEPGPQRNRDNARLEIANNPAMLHASRVAAALLLWTNVVWAQAVDPTGAIHRHVTGLGLRLPPNWSAQDQAEAVRLLPPGVRVDRNAHITELYMAVTQEGYSPVDESQIVKGLSAGFMRQGGQMTRSGEREAFTAGDRAASLYTWEVVDPADQKQYLLRLYLSPAGSRAFVLVALGPADVVRSHDSVLRQILAGLNFAAPQIAAGSALADDTPLAQKWLVKLRGKTVKQFISAALRARRCWYSAPTARILSAAA